MTSFYHYDGQFSTRQLSDASGQITDTYTYDAFGLLLARSGSTENNYLYTGEQYDSNVGFYYLRARYYNQANGRFLTQDVWPGMKFEPMSLHKYLYCENNPMNLFDPSGNMSTLMNFAITSVVYGILSAGVYGLINKCILNRNPDWWEYFVVGGIAAITKGVGLIEAAKITATGKIIIAAGSYAARGVTIDLFHGESFKMIFEHAIMNALIGATAHGVAGNLSPTDWAPNIPNSTLRVGIKLYIKEFKKFLKELSPPTIPELKESCEYWVNEFEKYIQTYFNSKPQYDYSEGE